MIRAMHAAQTFSLPTPKAFGAGRRPVVGRAGDGVEAFDLTGAVQSATLRYSRLKTCATCVAAQLVSAEADHARG
jgi:hypothetical protein